MAETAFVGGEDIFSVPFGCEEGAFRPNDVIVYHDYGGVRFCKRLEIALYPKGVAFGKFSECFGIDARACEEHIPTESKGAVNTLFRELDGDFAQTYEANKLKYEIELNTLIDKLDEVSFIS